MKSNSKPTAPLVIGWRELVDLPALGLFNLSAKIDTGARTSALHATNIEVFEKDGAQWVRFDRDATDDAPAQTLEMPVYEGRDIKNTSGVPEERVVIRTPFAVGDHKWTIDLSLTDRGEMNFMLIVGRTALREHEVAVHTGRSYLTRPSVRKPTRTIRTQPTATREDR